MVNKQELAEKVIRMLLNEKIMAPEEEKFKIFLLHSILKTLS
jgi:hypothetical protein